MARMKRTRHMRRLFEDCLEIRARGHGGRGAPSRAGSSARGPVSTALEAKRQGGSLVVGLAPRRPWRTKRSVHVCQSQPPSPSSSIHSSTSTIILSHSFHQCCHTTTMLPIPARVCFLPLSDTLTSSKQTLRRDPNDQNSNLESTFAVESRVSNYVPPWCLVLGAWLSVTLPIIVMRQAACHQNCLWGGKWIPRSPARSMKPTAKVALHFGRLSAKLSLMPIQYYCQ